MECAGNFTQNSLTMLRRLGWKSGDILYLVIDDTQKEKSQANGHGVKDF
ncbi:MAG: hypothetical protein LBJ67_13150 [Planctomycetaceae bacterium]|jgi:hypothetical protein|nr:hypothetical protein [Planctomycetaceae bacterium]